MLQLGSRQTDSKGSDKHMTQIARAQARKKKQRLSPQEREYLIVTGAIEFVAERGLGFSTRELANHLGISQSLLYRYFTTKEELVEKIYERVYLGRWNPEWDEILVDRRLTLHDRLEKYLIDYSKVVLQKDWVRIFLLSAFDDPIISQRYTTMLRRRIFEPILAEQLHELDLESSLDPDSKEMALELIWSFHASVFYMGVRQWVYKVPSQVDSDSSISVRVAAFLEGFRVFLRSLETK